jgi:hypothetical protein
MKGCFIQNDFDGGRKWPITGPLRNITVTQPNIADMPRIITSSLQNITKPEITRRPRITLTWPTVTIFRQSIITTKRQNITRKNTDTGSHSCAVSSIQ